MTSFKSINIALEFGNYHSLPNTRALSGQVLGSKYPHSRIVSKYPFHPWRFKLTTLKIVTYTCLSYKIIHNCAYFRDEPLIKQYFIYCTFTREAFKYAKYCPGSFFVRLGHWYQPAIKELLQWWQSHHLGCVSQNFQD